ncbi:hypothetical protein FKM82_030932 [Ascaphus truei]
MGYTIYTHIKKKKKYIYCTYISINLQYANRNVPEVGEQQVCLFQRILHTNILFQNRFSFYICVSCIMTSMHIYYLCMLLFVICLHLKQENIDANACTVCDKVCEMNLHSAMGVTFNAQKLCTIERA